MENYKIFFENLCLINKKYNLINSKKEDFNIFSILRNEYDEVNLHSKFIVELLKNKNYGKKFIEIFLEKLEIQVFNYENVNIFSEYSKGINGRIDILLEFSKDKEKKGARYIESMEKQRSKKKSAVKKNAVLTHKKSAKKKQSTHKRK